MRNSTLDPHPVLDGFRAGPRGEVLKLVHEIGGLRHYLGGEPVHAGDLLELRLPGGAWVLGRYEWSFRAGSAPCFYVTLGGDWERDAALDPVQTCLALPQAARLRWPERGR